MQPFCSNMKEVNTDALKQNGTFELPVGFETYLPVLNEQKVAQKVSIIAPDTWDGKGRSAAKPAPSYATLLELSSQSRNGGGTGIERKNAVPEKSYQNQSNFGSNESVNTNNDSVTDSIMTFQSFSFEIAPNYLAEGQYTLNLPNIVADKMDLPTNSSMKCDEASEKRDSNCFFSLLRYAADEISAKVDPTLKMQVYSPESPNSITDDGIRCKLGNISLYGTKEGCSRVKTMLLNNFEFTYKILSRTFIGLDVYNDHLEELKQLEERVSVQCDVEVALIKPYLEESTSEISCGFFEIQGKHPNVARAELELQNQMHILKGQVHETIQLESIKDIVALLGPQRKEILALTLEHNVRIAFDSSLLIKTEKSIAPVVIHITGPGTAVSKAKSSIADKIASRIPNIISRTWPCDRVKTEYLLLNEIDQLRSIVFQYGIVFSIEDAANACSDAVNITVHGTNTFAIHQASDAICALLHQYEQCTLIFEDEPEKLDYSVRDFDSFESLSTKLRIISQRTNAQIILQDKSIRIFGKESDIINALDYAKKLKIVQRHLLSCEYEIEHTNEIKEFISGKKDGKINKIIKETGIEIELLSKSDLFLLIKLRAFQLTQIPLAIEMLNGELPAEVSFFVPEYHHKRIIGHGGKNIQRIMKKYGVYIKFLNLDECIAKNGHPSQTAFNHLTKFLPNVVVKTPSKNKNVLNEMKAEVLMEANEQEVVLSSKLVSLPMGDETFFNEKKCDSIRRLLRESCVDYFFDQSGKRIRLFGIQDEVNIVSQHLTRILPVNCVTFHDAQFNGIFFRHLPNISCYFASFVDKSAFDSLSSVIVIPEQHSNKALMFANRPSTTKETFKQDICDLTSKDAFNGCFDSVLFSDTLKSVSDINSRFGRMVSSLAVESESRIPPPGLIQCHKKMPSKDDFTSFMWSAPLFTKDTKSISSNLDKSLSKLNTLDGTPTIESFLESLELTKYLESFKNHEIDFNALCTLSDSDLKEVGIYALGSRKKILNAIQTFKHVDGDLQTIVFNDSLQPRSSFLSSNIFPKESQLSDYDNIFSSYGAQQNEKHCNSFLNCNDFSRSILF